VPQGRSSMIADFGRSEDHPWLHAGRAEELLAMEVALVLPHRRESRSGQNIDPAIWRFWRLTAKHVSEGFLDIAHQQRCTAHD